MVVNSMTNLVLSTELIITFKEALGIVFWYKNQLKNFLKQHISHLEILNQLNWDDNKKKIVSELIDLLVKDLGKYFQDIISLIAGLLQIEDFTHFDNLENGKFKADKAKESINSLKKIILQSKQLQ